MNYPEIKKIVESCHLNFLIGSGASKPYFKTLNQIENQLTDLSRNSAINDEERAILETSIKQDYFEKCIEGNLEILSYDEDDSLKATKENYLKFLTSISTILARRRSNLVSKQVNLFTTNMDVFIDYTLEGMKAYCNDGFFGRIRPVFGTENFHNTIRKTSTHYEYQSEVPLFNLFKLHGSVNWVLNDDEITYDYDFSVLKSVRSAKASQEVLLPVEEQISRDNWKTFTIEELLENLKTELIFEYEQHEVFLKAYQNLVMINPTKEKFETTTRNLTFYELLRMYSNHLERSNSVLFVIGFSFADEHIREITKRVAIANPTLLIFIFAYDKAARDSISKLFVDRPNIKIIGGENDNKKYSLDVINRDIFEKIANEISKSAKDDEVQVPKAQQQVPKESQKDNTNG